MWAVTGCCVCQWWGVECGGVLGNVEFYAKHGQLWDVELPMDVIMVRPTVVD